jgi:voltage-gated potassium channel
MNNKNSQKSQFLVVKDTFKEIIDTLNPFLRKIKYKVINKNYGLFVFGLYVIIVVVFAFVYKSIHQANPNNFLISNSELSQNMKEQSLIDKQKSLSSAESELKTKQAEIDSIKSIKEALNLFDKSITYLVINNGIKPDSILYYSKHSFRLRLIKENSISYLVMPTFENKIYQYKIYVNYRKLLYYFSDDDDNSPININLFITNLKTKKAIYFQQCLYYSPSHQKYIDIKTFYGKSILKLSYWIQERLSEREKEYHYLEESKKEKAEQLEDVKHYLSFWDFLYFSTITQSSTGYGDILPNGRLVRMVVTLQIILGLFVLGIVITFRPKKED